MQQRVAQGDLRSVHSSAYRSRGSSGSAYQDEDDSQRTVPYDYKPTYGGTVSRIYSQSRDQSNSESSRTGSVSPVTYTSGGVLTQAQQRASQSESGSGQHLNIAVRPGTSTILAVPVRVIQTTGVADDQQQTLSRISEHSSGSSQTQHPTSSTYRVVYTPSRSHVSTDRVSSTSQSENSRTSGGVQKPEKLTNYDTFELDSASRSRFNTDERNSDSQVRVAPVYINYPANGGTSRVASTGSSTGGYSQTRVPVYPVHTVETVSNSRNAAEREESRYTPANPTYVSSNRNSESHRTAAERDERRYSPSNPTFISSRNTESSQGESRNQVSSGRTNYVAPERSVSSHQGSSQLGSGGSVYYAPSRTQTQAQHQSSGSQTQSQRQGQGSVTFTPVYGGGLQRVSNAQNTDYLSQRLGTGISRLNTDDLQTYMSESERLARLQQQQIGGSSSGSLQSASELNRRVAQQATSLDSAAAGFVSGSSLGNRFNEHENSNVNAAGTGAGTPGYQHVRSWNRQSEWSSGKNVLLIFK